MAGPSFLDQYTRSRRFTLGMPQNVRVSPDGTRLLFTRTAGGTETVASLWSMDVGNGTERKLVDPTGLIAADAVPEEVRRLQERSRNFGAGISGYATDGAMRYAAFGLAGRLWTIDVETGELSEVFAAGPVVDPRPSPCGEHIAYVSNGALRVIGRDGTGERALATPEEDGITYGLAEYVAAEDMHRTRGFWWAPTGDRLLVARVDNRAVQTWQLSNPADPLAEPVTYAYPAAGTANAVVTLSVIDFDGNATDIAWDRQTHEYLNSAMWNRHGAHIIVQSRDHHSMLLQRLDPDTGAVVTLREEHDDAWVYPVAGSGTFTGSGEQIWVTSLDDTYRLLIDGEAVTPVGMQVRSISAVDGDTVVFTASTEPTEDHLWTWSRAHGCERVTAEAGVIYSANASGGTIVSTEATLDSERAVVVRRGDAQPIAIASTSLSPSLKPRVSLLRAGSDELRTALLLPTGHQLGSKRLPVLMDPYGGPAGQRVLAARPNYVLSQWFADLGFAVLIADGRGVPGRGPAWDRKIYRDKVGPTLVDQITALNEVANLHPDLDLGKVAIRGWSYGGFLAAAAVLRRPDVFHAASAGAPPTDARLYSTYYQERYLGHPDENPEGYRLNSLLDDAPNLSRPLLLIHGLADDNVHPAHTLKLSAELQRAGKDHKVLAIPDMSHARNDPELSANLYRQEARFLLNALGMDTAPLDAGVNGLSI